MKKPSSIHKKSTKITPHQFGGFGLVIKAVKGTLLTYTSHSPYWFAKCELEKMLKEHDDLLKSNYKSLQIGRWRWVESDTRKRMHCDETRKTYTRLKKVGKKCVN